MAPLVIHHAQRLTVLRLITDVSTVHATVSVLAIVLAAVIAVAPLAVHAPAVAVEAVAVAVLSVAAVDVPVVAVDALADKRFVIPNLNPYIINNV